MGLVTEPPLTVLERWEQQGAHWRALHVSDGLAVIELRTCTGEPIDELRSTDRELIAYVRERGGSSEGAEAL